MVNRGDPEKSESEYTLVQRFLMLYDTIFVEQNRIECKEKWLRERKKQG